MQNFQTLLLGLAMMMSSLGSKYIQMEIDEVKHKFLSKPFMRFIFLLCLAYIGTRDLQLTVIVVALYFFIFKILFNYINNGKIKFLSYIPNIPSKISSKKSTENNKK